MSQAGAQSSPGLLATALAFLRGTTEMAADEVWPIQAGRVVRARSLPGVWALNHLRLAGPVTYEQATRLAEEHLADLPYRQLVVEDEHTTCLLEQPLKAAGWKIDRELLMALARAPDRPVDAAGVAEVEEHVIAGLMGRWVSEGDAITPEVRDQVVKATSREGRARGSRNLAVCDEDGQPVAMTKLYSDGRTAQVEDVYTVPAWRNRGCARRLIARAVDLAVEADHRLVFIVADDDGWPKHLYSRLGFDPIGRMGMFHLDL